MRFEFSRPSPTAVTLLRRVQEATAETESFFSVSFTVILFLSHERERRFRRPIRPHYVQEATAEAESFFSVSFTRA